MRLRAGDLRQVVDIYDPNTAQDGDGFPVSAAPKLMFRNVRAEIKTVGGGETVRGVQIEAGITSAVTLYYRDGVKPTMHLKDLSTGRMLNIVRADDPDGLRQGMICQCKEVA